MATLSEAQQRDFISQIIERLNENANVLNEKGYNPETKVGELTSLSSEAQTAETAQQKALREAKEASKLSQEKLKEAYDNASATVELIVGLLGKDHPLSQQLRKLRN